MADSAVRVLEPPDGPRTRPVDVRTNADGDSRQVVVIAPSDIGDIISPATEGTLSAVSTRLNSGIDVTDRAGRLLGTVTVSNQSDVSDLATEATLSALSGKIGIPTSDDVLTLLREIQTNTASEAVTVQTLHLDAQQIDLDVQGVESRLDTTNARIGTTGVPGSVAALLDTIRQQTVTPDVSDRAARILGHVTVDNPLALDTTAVAIRDRLPAALVNGRLPVDVGQIDVTVSTDTEFSAAAAIGDATVNPTTTLVGALGQVYNGTSWDRARSMDALNSTASQVRTGVAAVHSVLYDSNTGGVRVAKSAYNASDADAATNFSAAGQMIFNGTSWDRLRSVAPSAANLTPTGLLANAQHLWDGSTVSPTFSPMKRIAAMGDGESFYMGGIGNYVYNAANNNWDRLRSASSFANASGAVVGASAMQLVLSSSDSTNVNGAYGTWRSALGVGDGGAGQNTPTMANYIYNGATWDRLRGGAAFAISTGALAVGAESQIVTGTLAAANDAVTVDARGYQSVVINLVVASGGVGTILVEESADGVTSWSNVIAVRSDQLTMAGQISGTGSSSWVRNITNRFFRVRTLAPGTGTMAVTLTFQTHTSLGAQTILIGDASSVTASPYSVGSMGWIYNGASWDRVRSIGANTAANMGAGMGVLAVAPVAYDSGNYRGLSMVSNLPDAQGGTTILGTGGYIYNGTTWDRARSAVFNGASMTSGVAATSLLLAGASNFQPAARASAIADGDGGGGSIIAANWIFNGTTFDRLRSMGAAGVIGNVGVPGAAMVVSDGTNLQGVYSPAALADANALSRGLATGGYLYNGSTWDRARSWTAVAGAANGAGAAAVVNAMWDGAHFQGSWTASGLTDASAGTNILPIGNYVYNGATFDRLRGAVGATGAVQASPTASTAGGATPYKLISGASTNATSVKATAGNVYSIVATNTNAAIRFLKLYDKATAPTVGTDVPVQVYALPGNVNGAGITISLPTPISFVNGIAFALTTGIADTDATAVGLNDVAVSLAYK